MGKGLFSAVLALCALLPLTAQELNVAVAVPASDQQMTASKDVINLLRSKLQTAMSGSGLGMANYSGIVISPQTTIVSETVSEGGMRKVYVYDIDLSLAAIQVFTEATFHSVNITIRGEGFSKDKAIMAAIRKLSPSDSRLTSFFETTRTKILDYYKSNTQAIITKAQTLSSMQQYSEALALLSIYPETLPQYSTVAASMTKIYAAYQKNMCNDILQSARAAYAVGNYDDAAMWLSQVDGTSPCASEAKTLAEQIRKSIDTEQAREYALAQQELAQEADIEKQRILSEERQATAEMQAITAVANAYISSLPTYVFFY